MFAVKIALVAHVNVQIYRHAIIVCIYFLAQRFTNKNIMVWTLLKTLLKVLLCEYHTAPILCVAITVVVVLLVLIATSTFSQGLIGQHGLTITFHLFTTVPVTNASGFDIGFGVFGLFGIAIKHRCSFTATQAITAVMVKLHVKPRHITEYFGIWH